MNDNEDHHHAGNGYLEWLVADHQLESIQWMLPTDDQQHLFIVVLTILEINL